MLLLSIRTRAFCYLITIHIQPIVLDGILRKFWRFLLAVLVEMTATERHLERSEKSPAFKRSLVEDCWSSDFVMHAAKLFRTR